MESPSPKLTLDLSPPWLAGDRTKDPDKSSGLRDYISRLEDELRKIEAFKRELPLSVLLLTDAIARLKKEVVREGEEARAACNSDEFASVGSENDEDGDKKNWMSSAQLWSSDQTLSLQLNLNKPQDGESRPAWEHTENRGAITSFSHGPALSSPAKEAADCNKLVQTTPSLCLVTPEPAGLKKGGGRGGLQQRHQSPSDQSAVQGQRKQRRCWSPELHRRFIDALDRLGGPQVTTPKQIRELMQVNGLTNDEVKSHLQKYRLHIRKLPNSGTRDKLFPTTSKREINQSGSSEGPFHLAIRSATKFSSPGSRCDSMEDDYEEKSDSHSWEGE